MSHPARVRVLVVGDVMLDHYLWGASERLSPEAPVPVVDVRREDWALGGAGNVVANLAALDADVALVTISGDSEGHGRLQQLLDGLGVRKRTLIADTHRPVTIKTRLMAGHHQLLRYDVESRKPVEGEHLEALKAAVDSALAQCQAVVLSDYGKGTLSPELCAHILRHAGSLGLPVVVDPKGRDYGKYRGATVVTPNRKEAAEAAGFPLNDEQALKRAGAQLCESFGLKACLITLSEEGMALFSGSTMERIPTRAREVFDVTGAGDTVVAALAYGLGQGTPLPAACRFANLAAGVVVGKLGAATATQAEVEAFDRHQGAIRAEAKVASLSALQPRISALQGRGRRVIFTNGCFDILHAGHVRYLEEARALGDVLVVGVNSDASVRRLKGEARPVNPAHDRLLVLAGLSAVDHVVLFEEDTPLHLIEGLRPDVLVKGGDYSEATIVGAPLVRSYGGLVTTIPLYPGRSTTGTIARMTKDTPT